MTIIKGGRERIVQIKKTMARRPATKVSMMETVDNGAGSGRRSREGGKNHKMMGAVKASSGWQQQE